jgi:hypothetical protein
MHIEAADEMPVAIPARCAVMVGTDADPKWLAFNCPCGTGHQIMLNLDRRRSPSWAITDQRRLTIKPSIDARRPGGWCHYFVLRGKVKWVSNTEMEPQR